MAWNRVNGGMNIRLVYLTLGITLLVGRVTQSLVIANIEDNQNTLRHLEEADDAEHAVHLSAQAVWDEETLMQEAHFPEDLTDVETRRIPEAQNSKIIQGQEFEPCEFEGRFRIYGEKFESLNVRSKCYRICVCQGNVIGVYCYPGCSRKL